MQFEEVMEEVSVPPLASNSHLYHAAYQLVCEVVEMVVEVAELERVLCGLTLEQTQIQHTAVNCQASALAAKSAGIIEIVGIEGIVHRDVSTPLVAQGATLDSSHLGLIAEGGAEHPQEFSNEEEQPRPPHKAKLERWSWEMHPVMLIRLQPEVVQRWRAHLSQAVSLSLAEAGGHLAMCAVELEPTSGGIFANTDTEWCKQVQIATEWAEVKKRQVEAERRRTIFTGGVKKLGMMPVTEREKRARKRNNAKALKESKLAKEKAALARSKQSK